MANSRLIDVMVKQIVIGIAVTLCSGGFSATVAILFRSFPKGIMTDYVVRAVEGGATSWLLYLGLFINDAMYRKVCGCCHRCCYRCAVQIPRRDCRYHKRRLLKDGR